MRRITVPIGEVARINQGLSTSGRGAGVRPGNWRVRIVGAGDIQDDALRLDRAEAIGIEQNVRTEKHLLSPNDVLVAARAAGPKAALTPSIAERVVADAGILVVRPHTPGWGPYLWWFLTSTPGRQQVQGQMTGSTALLSLTAAALASIEVPEPTPRELYLISDLVDVTERAYNAALDAAYLRRSFFRDHIMEGLRDLMKPSEGGNATDDV